MARVKTKNVRVTNPSINEIPGLMIQPAKTVAAFGVGAAVGNIALTPVTDAIDNRLDEGWKRGAAKLATATAILTAIAVATEKSKAKPRSDTKVLITAAGVGGVSRLITTGIDDFMGRSASSDIIDADFDEVDDDDAPEEMGAVINASFFDNPQIAQQQGMLGTAAFNNASFNTYQP